MTSSSRINEDGHLAPADQRYADLPLGAEIPKPAQVPPHLQEEYDKLNAEFKALKSANTPADPDTVATRTDTTMRARIMLAHLFSGDDEAAIHMSQTFTPDECQLVSKHLQSMHEMIVAQTTVHMLTRVPALVQQLRHAVSVAGITPSWINEVMDPETGTVRPSYHNPPVPVQPATCKCPDKNHHNQLPAD